MTAGRHASALLLALTAAYVAVAATPPPTATPPATAVVPALVTALADPDAAVRERAAAALGRLGAGASAAVEPLVGALADPDPYVAGAAAVALGRIGEPAVPLLVRALGATGEKARWSAAIALGRLGASAREATPVLAGALADANDEVRACAATALGEIGPAAVAAAAALTESLHDRDEDVRRAARIALARVAPVEYLRPPTRAEAVATIDRLVPALQAELHVPGVAVAVIHGGAVAWSAVYGTADATTGAPVTHETLFEAASMSKPVFAMLAMQLVAAGRLDLDRPIEEVAPELAVPAQPWRRTVTARHLLSHTSGFPNWRPGGEEREGPLPLLFEPGARFAYSGEGVFRLQRAVERLTGQPLEVRAHESLFAPLGLRGTSFAWDEVVESRLASGHAADGTFLARSRYRHANAAYTLVTTAEEYARLVVAVMDAARSGSPVLSRRAAREMLRPQVELDARDPIERPGAAEGRTVHWALGWSLNTTAAGDIYHHSGANRTGFRSFAQFSPSRGSGLVVLTNGLGGGELWTRLVAAIGDL